VGYPVRIASYNLRDFKDDAAAAARVVRAIDPDVLCLQEVPRRLLSSYRIASFAARCGLYWSGSHGGSGGTTVMSSLRVDVTNTKHVPLEVARLQRPRGYAVCQLRVPGQGVLELVSVHLSLDPDERVRHVAAVLGSRRGDRPIVLAGDLNEGPDGAAWMAIAGGLRAVSGDAPTFPAAHPRHRIDAIFASPKLSVLPETPIGLRRSDLVAATDHLPVWVDLEPSDPAQG
jgi:endonuclease/exonuclease/phosphatase family metal-dependent hydrolase